jgi:hypothetical protein
MIFYEQYKLEGLHCFLFRFMIVFCRSNFEFRTELETKFHSHTEQSTEFKEYRLLGCDTVKSDRSLPTFRRKVLIPSTGSKLWAAQLLASPCPSLSRNVGAFLPGYILLVPEDSSRHCHFCSVNRSASAVSYGRWKQNIVTWGSDLLLILLPTLLLKPYSRKGNCTAWSITLRVEHKRGGSWISEVTSGWKKLNNEEGHNLYSF